MRGAQPAEMGAGLVEQGWPGTGTPRRSRQDTDNL